MKVYISAYTLAPSGVTWDVAQESDYYTGLKSIPDITGLEIAVGESFHSYDENWFLQNIDPDWRFIATGMPGVMANMADNPHCGIASQDSNGRRQALDFYRIMQQSILRLHDGIGRSVVEAIQIHTAPNRNLVDSSADALVSSLREITSWNWGGAKLVIEHCDAAINDKPVEKGFLSIAEEIQALNQLNPTLESKLSISVNWGRSAIEAQSVEGPLVHISELNEAGLLYGDAYSGASDQAGAYGVWCDTHMPFAPCFGMSEYASASLLTFDELKRCLQATEPTHETFVGVKIAAQPNTLNTAERIQYYRDACDILRRAGA